MYCYQIRIFNIYSSLSIFELLDGLLIILLSLEVQCVICTSAQYIQMKQGN